MRDGRVRLRSNVIVEEDDGWQLVPGELRAIHGNGRLTRLQHDEKMYYAQCSVCRRRIDAIMREGCERCSHGPTPRERDAARALHRNALEAVESARRKRATPPGTTTEADGPRPDYVSRDYR
jgi:hypothetical protein